MKKKSPIYDNIVGCMVSDFFDRNREYPTLSKITACFNISIGLFRACCVRGDRKGLIRLANQFHRELMKEIDLLCEDRA